MAFEEQITETIEAGAPSIKYEGDIQQQQQIAQQLWENLPPQVQAQFGSFEQFFSSGAWKKVLQMLQQQQQQGQQPQEMAQGPQQMAPQPQEGIASMMPAQMADGGDVRLASASDPMDDKNQLSLQLFGKPVHKLTPDELIDLDEWMEDKAQKWGGAYGGIAGADGRRQYGIGSWFQKKIMDPIKKNWKPLAAIAGGAALNQWGIPGTGKDGGPNWGKDWLGGILNKTREIGNVDNDVVREKRFDLSGLGGALMNKNFMIPAASLVSGAFAKQDEPGYTGQGTGLNLQNIAKLANITDEKQGQAIGLNFLPEASARKYSPEEMAATYAGSAHGGRIGAEEGGLMSLGGNEMDLRGGGFVPLGEQEKADDVPARLSKNEFVFTADAVRAAGGGNVDAGADKMYNTMKQLEGRVG